MPGAATQCSASATKCLYSPCYICYYAYPPSATAAVLLKTIERDPTIIKYRLGLED